MGLQNPRLDRDIILNRRRQLSGSKAERQWNLPAQQHLNAMKKISGDVSTKQNCSTCLRTARNPKRRSSLYAHPSQPSSQLLPLQPTLSLIPPQQSLQTLPIPPSPLPFLYHDRINPPPKPSPFPPSVPQQPQPLPTPKTQFEKTRKMPSRARISGKASQQQRAPCCSHEREGTGMVRRSANKLFFSVGPILGSSSFSTAALIYLFC